MDQSLLEDYFFPEPVVQQEDGSFAFHYKGYNVKLKESEDIVNISVYGRMGEGISLNQGLNSLTEKYPDLTMNYNDNTSKLQVPNSLTMNQIQIILEDIVTFYQRNGYVNCNVGVNPEAVNINSAFDSSIQIKENFILGSLGALLGAIPGIILWIIIARFGIYAFISGVAISGGVFFGYLLLGKVGSYKGAAICIIIIITATYMAIYADCVLNIMKELDYSFMESMKMIEIAKEIEPRVSVAYKINMLCGYFFSIASMVFVYRKYFRFSFSR